MTGKKCISGVGVLLVAVIWMAGSAPFVLAQSDGRWKAGVARAVITPDGPLWMRGYAFRDHPATEKIHDIWVKVLALEDANGTRAVLITSDLAGINKEFSDTVRNRIHRQTGLERRQIILNTSHTHTGPLLERDHYTTYDLPPSQQERVAEYTRWLESTMVETVVGALGQMEPSTVKSGKGVARFAVNRRNNNADELDKLTELAGPVSHDVPVLKVTSPEGNVRAIVFGYACHPTTLSRYKWSGDWPGFAQIELEERYPEATALFVAGAGGDQNPLPRRTVPLARQYGQQLAASVDRVLNEDMKTLEPQLNLGYAEIELELSELPTVEELQTSIDEHSGYQADWARHLLQRMEAGEEIRTHYPYPVQMWGLGNQVLVALGGELLVDYAIGIKRLMGQDVWVAGYSNDVMAYIPSLRVLREGGYEGSYSMKAYGMPSTWAPDIEQRIMDEVIQMAHDLNIPVPESPLVR